jgi:hypothetical protein
MTTLTHEDGTEHEVADGLGGLVPLVWAKGMTTEDTCDGSNGEPGKNFAYIVFPNLGDAAEFLLHIAHITNYKLGDNVALTIFHPSGDIAHQPRGKVAWMPLFTELFVKVWS